MRSTLKGAGIPAPLFFAARIYFPYLLPELTFRTYFPNLFPEHGVVAGCAHEEQHHDRQEGVGSRCQKSLAGHGFCFVRNGSSVGGVVASPLNQAFLNAQDDSPDVERQDPSDAAADADRKQPIALPSMAVQA